MKHSRTIKNPGSWDIVEIRMFIVAEKDGKEVALAEIIHDNAPDAQIGIGITDRCIRIPAGSRIFSKMKHEEIY